MFPPLPRRGLRLYCGRNRAINRPSSPPFLIGAFLALLIAAGLAGGGVVMGMIPLIPAVIGGLISYSVAVVGLAFWCGRAAPDSRHRQKESQNDRGDPGADDISVPTILIAGSSPKPFKQSDGPLDAGHDSGDGGGGGGGD